MTTLMERKGPRAAVISEIDARSVALQLVTNGLKLVFVMSASWLVCGMPTSGISSLKSSMNPARLDGSVPVKRT